LELVLTQTTGSRAAQVGLVSEDCARTGAAGKAAKRNAAATKAWNERMLLKLPGEG
jgi:hypothetical protein